MLQEAEAEDSIVVSVASLVDLWYVTQTTQAVSAEQLAELRGLVTTTSAIHLQPIGVDVADVYTTISREVLSDPWDRFIVATAQVLGLPLVTRDGPIHESGLVETIW